MKYYRSCAALCCLALSLARAAQLNIADAPLETQNNVPVNIMFTLDDSRSMTFLQLPDNVGYGICYFTHEANKIAYNPKEKYLTPLDPTTRQPVGNASFKAAFDDYFRFGPGKTVDLEENLLSFSGGKLHYAVPASSGPYCNLTKKRYEAITISSTDMDQATNYANWYSFHRSRILTMKTALTRAFVPFDGSFNIGFSVLNRGTFMPIKSFTGSHREQWFKTLYAVVPYGGTPLRNALERVGEYFRTGYFNGANHGHPITQTCQLNFEILSTDGLWNESDSRVMLRSSQDTDVPNVLPISPLRDPIAGVDLIRGKPMPRPFFDEGRSRNSLADIAMKYWITDLRPDMADKVLPSAKDPATWQHLSTYTIGLGLDGKIPFSEETYDARLFSNKTPWPKPESGQVSTVDDLWHAAVNGHGLYFSAKDPQMLQQSLTDLLNNIIARLGSGAPVATSNPEPTENDNTLFSSNYNSQGWWGDLLAYPIQLTGKMAGQPELNKPLWAGSASNQLNAKKFNSRLIASYVDGKGVPFSTAGLGSAVQRLKSPGGSDNDSAKIIAFLQGDRSLEGKDYRVRKSVLGDIINAAPLFVGAPNKSYVDKGYDKFKTDKAARQKVVYQGANDGMLHAFNGNGDASGGGELWAYVPGRLIDMPWQRGTSLLSATSSLVNLSSLNDFSHRYYVDATPVSGDIDTTADGNGWKTILVGGLGKGGRGYYALDITDPSANNSQDVAAKVLWEFPKSQSDKETKNIGYTFGQPIITKLMVGSQEKWAVLDSSGYNNGKADTGGDGLGHLYVLDANDGSVLKDIPTDTGSTTNPSGLAYITAYTETRANENNLTKVVYGGDLEGNVWRFDLSASNSSDWKVTKLAQLKYNNNVQPIMTAPTVVKVDDFVLVMVGTGQYFGTADVPGGAGATAQATQQQSFYGLKDDGKGTQLSVPTNLVEQRITLSADKQQGTISDNSVDYSTRSGWYVHFPNSAERLVFPAVLASDDPSFNNTNVVVNSFVPRGDPCDVGGSSWQYIFDYKNDGKSKIDGVISVAFQDNTGLTQPVIIHVDGKIIGLSKQTLVGGIKQSYLGDVPVEGSKRILWRSWSLP